MLRHTFCFQGWNPPMRTFTRACLAVTVALVAILALPSAAKADGDQDPAKDPAKDPQVARLLNEKKTPRWNAPVAGSKERYGHAEALVDAPADQVAKTAVDFRGYKDLHRKFKTARVIGKEGDATDVYMRYPVTIGALTIELHEIMRFSPPRMSGTNHVIEARGLKGDMKSGHTIITVKPIDAKHCVLEVDVLLVPSLPAPQSFIDEELRDGAGDFVSTIRDKAQGRVGPVVSL
jgi:hypothetical protein